MARLKEAAKAGSYAELGRLLGLSTSAYANRKKADSIPYDAVIPLARSLDVSLDWLIFGEHVPGAEIASEVPVEIDPDLLARVMIELHRTVRPEADQAALIDFGRLASLAGLVYNRVAYAEDDHERNQLMRSEVQGLAHAMRLMESADLQVATKAEPKKPAGKHQRVKRS